MSHFFPVSFLLKAILPPYVNPSKIFRKEMISGEYPIKSPENPCRKQPEIHGNCPRNESLFSPGFRSVAAMAGWDEEALLVASLIVEDTPDRQFKLKRRSVFRNSKTPPSNSRRKRKAQRQSSAAIPVTVLNLDEDEPKSKLENEKTTTETNKIEDVEKKRVDDEVNSKDNNGISTSIPVIPCIDRLREELSCAICLEICYEPSTTPCGHSFCKKCLRSAADRCGKKCPKCRNLISNGKYCTVNTVLWNTIQLLFPQEVEARKTAESESSTTEKREVVVLPRTRSNNSRNRTVEALLESPETERNERERRRIQNRIRSRSSTRLPNQDEDAALALRLQREEFMGNDERRNRSVSTATARDNLRAMAARAINIRVRARRD